MHGDQTVSPRLGLWSGEDAFAVKDANGMVLATVHGHDLQRWTFGHNRLTSDEAMKIAKAISRTRRFSVTAYGASTRSRSNSTR